MVELAIADNPAFSASTVDIDRPGPHYTIDTIRRLRDEWKTGAEETFFIMGVDSLAQLPTWHQPQQFIECCRLAVVARPNYDDDLADLEAALPGLSRRLHWAPMPAIGISATDLQLRVREGRSIRYQVPAAVAQYVSDHNLYCQS
jgi:nicotinate-nucleotide adenylyltransferase